MYGKNIDSIEIMDENQNIERTNTEPCEPSISNILNQLNNYIVWTFDTCAS